MSFGLDMLDDYLDYELYGDELYGGERTMTKLVTGVVRLSYAHLFEPYSQSPDSAPKYSVTLLIPKSDAKTMQKIKAARAKAAALWQEKNPKSRLPANQTTIYDGDGQRPRGDDFGPECAGHYVVTVSSKTRPVIVDRGGNEILDSHDVYSGCYARASIQAYVFDTNGNRGITFGLLGVQKWKDGEALGGTYGSASDFEDGFEDDEDELLG